MPKLTKTGYEIGSSDAPVIVLHKNKFGDTRQAKLDKFKKVRAGVELLPDRPRNPGALRRGTHLEHGVATWAQEELEILTSGAVEMYEPTEAFKDQTLKIASSVDRIITLEEELELEGHRFSGQGICEIKTDFYHQGKPHAEWLIQVHHQMICTGLPWGIIACMDQHGKLHFYPVPFEQKLIDVMVESYAEFWKLVETDGDYPPEAEAPKPELVDISEMLPQTNQDLEKLCADYLKASAEETAWRKTKAEVKDAIVFALDALNVEHAKLPGFVIKSQTVNKPKKQMVETGEYYETLSFSVKEASGE